MEYIKSPLNYNGNKYKLLPQILPLFPNKISTFVDLFGGSGAVSLNTSAEHVIYNDIIPYIGNILNGIKELEYINSFIENTLHRTISYYGLSKTNKEGFENLRADYNSGKKDWWVLYLLMCYSFNNQFRFNNNHQYNSSFGWYKSCFSNITEQKLLKAKEELDDLDIVFTHYSFEDFDFSDFDENDFVYLDPPYFNSIGNYNDGKRGFKDWDLTIENKMRELLVSLNTQNVKWALSNNLKCNDSLFKWAKDNSFRIYYLDESYSNSNYHKKDKQSKDIEVLITNY